jgi:nitroreductase
MEWEKLIQERHTTFAWRDEVPSREIIEEVLQELYNHIPSKNLMFPWSVYVLRNNNPKITKELMTICHRNLCMSPLTDLGNPQVMAPWLIGFANRWVQDLEVRYDARSTRTDDAQRDTEQMEIGMASLFLSYAFANRGIQTGFCQNINNLRDRAGEIFSIDEGQEFRFIMGVGYGKDRSIRHQYLDPRTNKYKPIPIAPDSVTEGYPRPDFDKIFTFVDNEN